MDALARESELRTELAAIMARQDELLAELQTGRERTQAILAELETLPKAKAVDLTRRGP